MTNREYLFHLERHGIKLGLENIGLLLNAAENPHDQFRALHIAGTNGKGSVAAMTASICRAAGYKTASFTSPHLIDITERFIIDGQPISDREFDEQLDFFRPVAETMDPPPTFFEFTTAMGFRWFAQQRVDVAVIEVGMGGRLDSTNVLTPLAAAITNIEIEHARYLGATIEEIAWEKAGIIKKAVPVVVGETKPAAQTVILNRAKDLGVAVSLIGRDFSYEMADDGGFAYRTAGLQLPPLRLGLAGRFQGQNAAVAVALIDHIAREFLAITKPTITAGLEMVRWPCRLEKVLDTPPVTIDVAHNPAGVGCMVSDVKPGITVLAVSADKDIGKMVAALAPVTRLFILTQFQSPRALPVKQLEAIAGTYPHQCAKDLKQALDIGMAMASEETPLLITGSIFTAGEARKILIDTYGAPPLRF